MGSWHVDVPPLARCGSFVYSEGSLDLEVEYELAGGDIVIVFLVPANWDAKFPWASGRKTEVMNRIADAVIERGDPAWRKDVRAGEVIGIKLHREVEIDVGGRRAEYREGPRAVSFEIRKGSGRLALTICGPESSQWGPFDVRAPRRRHEIIASVADAVIRRLAPGCIPDYDESRPNEMKVYLPSSAGGGFRSST
jgi:hypothetical protein